MNYAWIVSINIKSSSGCAEHRRCKMFQCHFDGTYQKS